MNSNNSNNNNSKNSKNNNDLNRNLGDADFGDEVESHKGVHTKNNTNVINSAASAKRERPDELDEALLRLDESESSDDLKLSQSRKALAKKPKVLDSDIFEGMLWLWTFLCFLADSGGCVISSYGEIDNMGQMSAMITS